MEKRRWMWLSVGVILIATAAIAGEKKASKTVTMTAASGAVLGTATIEQEKEGGVEIQLSLHGLTPGEHALHFHQTASCIGPDFKSAGGHFNPTAAHHGLNNPSGPHAGDMDNFMVGPDGTAHMTVSNPRVTLEPGQPNSLLSNGGTALVIHAKADDLMSDPAGNAGDRVGCGVITP